MPQEIMKKYEFNITEVSEKLVVVFGESLEEAKQNFHRRLRLLDHTKDSKVTIHSIDEYREMETVWT